MFDMFQLDFMVYAFVATLITGILLSYLGMHVVRRGIVFVDLALGQISMLGVAVGALLGFWQHLIPILFTLLGALLMSMITVRDKRLKQEAIIGIVYAIASALTVLVISKTPHGDADIQEVLFGSILAVSPEEIRTVATVFAAIALLQAVFFRRFFKITDALSRDEDVGMFNLWNGLFFISIGLAIVYAVKVDGVIPVFSFLIIPTVSGILLFRSEWLVLATAFTVCLLSAFLGLYCSFTYDFPAGSSIVAVMGGLFALSAVIRGVLRYIVFKR
ncbi:MAG: metal ABC transporter permease [Flavobacteriales bacterium]